MNNSGRSIAFALLTSVTILGSVEARGQNWQVLSGTWSNTANWSGNVLPTGSDSAFIANGGTADITQLGATCGTLSLGGGGSGTVLMTAGGLSTAGDLLVGDTGSGSFVQSGGVATVTGADGLYLGNQAGATGTYCLSGSGLLSVAQNEYVGWAGNGIFTQSGGTNSTGGLTLRGNPGDTATYCLSGSGVLSVQGGESIQNGSFTQSGGVNTILNHTLGQGGLYVDALYGVPTSYNLSGGQLSTLYEDVGYNYNGSFTQSGGTNTIYPGGYLIIGFFNGSSGTYNLGGSGLLNGSYDECVGYSGTGSFTQSGGTNSTGYVLVGYYAGSSGTYSLSGSSQLSAPLARPSATAAAAASRSRAETTWYPMFSQWATLPTAVERIVSAAARLP